MLPELSVTNADLHPTRSRSGSANHTRTQPSDKNGANPVPHLREQGANDVTTALIALGVQRTLELLGEDPEREGLLKTPERVAKAHQFLTHGYAMDPEAILTSALFEEDYDEMILVRDIEIYSLCEHHMLPFYGKAHVAYIPNGKIVGLSKIPRVVDVFARRLQVQERLTMQIRDAIQSVLQPQGVAVVVEATHLCMVMRGVQKQHSTTTTSAMSGTFLTNQATRDEFMSTIGSR